MNLNDFESYIDRKICEQNLNFSSFRKMTIEQAKRRADTLTLFHEIKHGKYEVYTSYAVIDEINKKYSVSQKELIQD